MAKVVVVFSYDDAGQNRGVLPERLPLDVVRGVRHLFPKNNFEVHKANGKVALDIEDRLANQEVGR